MFYLFFSYKELDNSCWYVLFRQRQLEVSPEEREERVTGPQLIAAQPAVVGLPPQPIRPSLSAHGQYTYSYPALSLRSQSVHVQLSVFLCTRGVRAAEAHLTLSSHTIIKHALLKPHLSTPSLSLRLQLKSEYSGEFSVFTIKYIINTLSLRGYFFATSGINL